jgi:DNA modification methylase
MTNKLFYGDNLTVLRDSIADESVDLIYLDPPFNSNASYNVLFKAPSGEQSQAQIEAFDDTWHWNESAERAFDEVLCGGHSDAAIMLKAMRSALGENDMMAYLAMMAVRLIELHRVLKPTGSLYLHCDPTASHYLKILLDAIFGPINYRNEIVWRRTGSHNSSKRFGPIHDVIHFVTKSNRYKFHRRTRPYMRGHVEKAFRKDGDRYFTNYSGNILTGSGKRNGMSGQVWKGFNPTAKGRHWALPGGLLDGLEDETEGMNQHEKMDFLFEKGFITINPGDEWPRYNREITSQDGQYLSDMWAYQPYTDGTVFGTKEGIDDDVRWMGSKDGDRLGYETQKPVGLLERIISASSNEGDVILDPFCGCGTTVHAAQKLNRQWIGIDITHLAVALIEHRLKAAFAGIAYEVHGVPKDVAGATDLAARDKHEFQKWIVATIEGQPYKGGKKGMDRGIDGYLHFRDADKKAQFAIISVKGGGIKSGDIRDLKGTMEREGAALGIFLTLNPPTREMEKEAASAGFYETGGRKFPRLQILTAAQVIDDRRPQVPFGFTESLKKASRETEDRQGTLI